MKRFLDGNPAYEQVSDRRVMKQSRKGEALGEGKAVACDLILNCFRVKWHFGC